MKTIFLCLGTRGDVQPYVAIGVAAKQAGHSVTICTGNLFRSFVEENGLLFTPCSLDFMEILQTPAGKEILETGTKHPIKAIKYANQVIRPLYRIAMKEFYEASKGMDVIIYHPKAYGAVDIAEKLGILCIPMPPVPILYPVSSFPNLAISTKDLGKRLNRFTYLLVNKGAESNSIKDINAFRIDSLSLPTRKSGQYMLRRENESLPIIYPISPKLFSGVKEFTEGPVYLSGFPALPGSTSLDEETLEFLAKGAPPLVITFSSMPLRNPALFVDKLLYALEKSNHRAILLLGNSGMPLQAIQEASCETILCKESLPHPAIFALAKGILHHGGVGTMAAALRSGKPQVIMPFQVDQPFWAKLLYQQGYCLKPLTEQDTKEVFLERFLEMNSPETAAKAEEIARLLSTEDGNSNAVLQIEMLQKDWAVRHG